MPHNINHYDVIVVGGGHAGCEAAAVCARTGCNTLLITIKKSNIGEMSCNPAIGGLGKGQLVKEIDALGGVMARAADYGGIQFRQLNMSKGPAVRSSRAQEDRKRYKEYMLNFLSNLKNLKIYSGTVVDVLRKNSKVYGVVLKSSEEIFSDIVILTPGTFLNGTIYVGLKKSSGGRIGEKSSKRLPQVLLKMGFKMMTFKTGTCPRLDGSTIDFSALTQQKGDKNPAPFSFTTATGDLIKNQISCYITHTNSKTHKIIRSGFSRSPVYRGVIKGTGVRYCPSVEDKIVRFPAVRRHQIFLEPEGLNTNVYYPNGISTSLPSDVQDEFIRTIKGLEDVRIVRYGYGIEYDVVEPTELYPTLETKKFQNLYLAGQVNGTTGYEEAAALGLMAGLNAAAKIMKIEPLVLRRHQAYIGVLIDDLVTRGTSEPYRMFTSRAEYRLLLREDNAHLRLTETGFKYRSVSRDFYNKVMDFKRYLEEGRKIINNIKVEATQENKKRFNIKETISAGDLLKNPLIKLNDVRAVSRKLADIRTDIAEELDIEIKYSGYIKRQTRDIKKMESMNDKIIGRNMDYGGIGGLSREVVEKLKLVKPQTLGQAARIPGITPAAISSIMIHIKGKERRV